MPDGTNGRLETGGRRQQAGDGRPEAGGTSSLQSAACSLTVVYAVTPDQKYRRMAAGSIYTAVRHNPGVRVRVVEVEGGDYPPGIKPAALADVTAASVLFLDADTVVRGSLGELLACDADFSARVATAWLAGGFLSRRRWAALCSHFGLPPVQGFNSGAFLCRGQVARSLAQSWPRWMEAIRHAGVSDPQLQPAKSPWWMLDQYALALAVAEIGCRVRLWSRAEHSFGWKGEVPGLIHHTGARRWEDPLR